MPAVSSAAEIVWPNWDWEMHPVPVDEPFQCNYAIAVAVPAACPADRRRAGDHPLLHVLRVVVALMLLPLMELELLL